MENEKISRMSQSKFIILARYIWQLNSSGKACAFMDLAGHVNSIRIAVFSDASTDTQLYETYFYYDELNKYCYLDDGFECDTWREAIDTIIEDIDSAIRNLNRYD